MDEIKFEIRTTMEKEDYRKFLYLATFLKNKFVIPIIALISFVGSLMLNWDSEDLDWTLILLYWLGFFIIAVSVICFKLERRNKQRIKTDKTGAFGSENVLKFYEDKVIMENTILKSTGELKYEQFFSLLESKNYFIFYLTANQASLLRKKDIQSLDMFKKFILDKFKGKYKNV
ncbi:MAG: YcxB family protein [Eubacteriales bacterium]|nr:YcxB family protein [Eubacteriales bacterium]